MKTLLLILLLAIPALPCGAPQYLFGVVHNGLYPIRNAIVRVNGDVIQTGSFGWYSTMLGGCPDHYVITVTQGRYHFEPVEFWSDGSGAAININIEAAPIMAPIKEE